jgi:hypothetical protein
MSRKLAALIFLASALPLAHADPGQDVLDKPLAEQGLIPHINQSISRATELVMTAMSSLDVPYRWGGTSAETGFDCSGFVRAMFQQAVGLVLPRRAVDQAAATTKIDKTELKPGDLVFFHTRRRNNYSHVGIYLGDGKFIHSPHSGSQVEVESMRAGYWRARFTGARRVLKDESASANITAPFVTDRNAPAPTTVRLGRGVSAPVVDSSSVTKPDPASNGNV